MIIKPVSLSSVEVMKYHTVRGTYYTGAIRVLGKQDALTLPTLSGNNVLFKMQSGMFIYILNIKNIIAI